AVIHRGRDIDAGRSRPVARHHDVDARRDRLVAEPELVGRRRSRSQRHGLLAGAEEQRLARTDRGAHRLLADRRAVVAHVALHHDRAIDVELGDAERAGDDAVAARDAARLASALHDAIAGALDRIGRADLRAGRLLAVHAHHRHGLDRRGAIDVLEVDHRVTAVGVALGAGLDARLAADATAGIDEELEVLGDRHGFLLLRLVGGG